MKQTTFKRLHTVMKATILITAFFFLLNCNQSTSNDFDINKLIELEYRSYEKEGDTINYVTYNLVKNNDSIGKIVTQRDVRIDYILANEIDFSALNKLYPDSISIEKEFKQQLNSDAVKPYIIQIIYPELKRHQKSFTEKDVMLVASRFVLVEKRGDRGFGARICYTKNGQEQSSDILLEAVVIDALRYNGQNEKESLNINSLVSDFIKKAYQENQNIKSMDSLEPIIRDYVFNSMESDLNYKKMILNYLKENENNLPFLVAFNK